MQDSTAKHNFQTDLPISAEWQQQAELLGHLCQFSQNLLCVVGPSKSGKTAFLQYFLQLPQVGLRKHAITECPDTVEQLMQLVAQKFQLPWEQNHGANKTLQSVTHETDETWVLLIDDAEKLSDQCLTAVLNLLRFDVTPKQQLHVILLGQPQIEQRLENAEYQQILQGRSHTLELAANTLQMPPQSQTPRKIQLDENKLADNIPAAPAKSQAKASKKTQPNSKAQGSAISATHFKQYLFHPISFGAVVGIGLGIVYLMLNPLDDVEWQSPPTHAAQLAEATYQSERIALTNPPKLKVEVVSERADEELLDEMEIESNNIPLAEQVPILSEEAGNQAPPQKSSALPPESKAKESSKLLASAAESVNRVRNAKKESLARLTDEEKYLLNSNQKNYTLQLMGGTNEDSLKDFIKRNNLEDLAYTYRKEVGGQSWYVVVLGSYADRQSANEAVVSLKDLIQEDLKPWVRSMGSIQTEIKDSRG